MKTKALQSLTCLLAIICLLCSPIFAQKKKISATFSLAEKNFNNYRYYMAALLYTKVLENDPNHIDATYKLAESYRMLYDYKNAENYYKIVANRWSSEYPQARYWYAVMLKDNGKYDEAIKEFTKYRQTHADADLETELYKERALKEIEGCEFAKKQSRTGPFSAYNIKLLPSPVNSVENDYAAIILDSDSSICITSSRKGSKGRGEDVSYGGSFSDAYRFVLNKYGVWMEPSHSNHDGFNNLNSPFSESAGSFTKDKKKYYFTRCDERIKVDNYEEYNCIIYVSYFENSKWSKPIRLNENINMPGQWNSQPNVSPDGNILFFVSKRPGGLGMHDIWYSIRTEGENWAPPVNIGPPVNTFFRDVSPKYIPEQKILFFSSDGHGGLGGLDIYMTREEDAFSTITNVGAPINSNRDDFYFTLGNSVGYFTSNRDGGIGGDDIYTFKYFAKKPSPTMATNKDASTNFANTNNTIAIDRSNNPPNEEFYKNDSLTISSPSNSISTEPSLPTVLLPDQIISTKENIVLENKTVPIITIKKDSLTNVLSFIVRGVITELHKGSPATSGVVRILDEDQHIVNESLLDSDGSYNIEVQVLPKTYQVFYYTEAPIKEVFLPAQTELILKKKSLAPPKSDVYTIAEIPKDSMPDARSILIEGTIYYETPHKPASNITILLVDESGNTIKTTKTNEEGYFKFSNLPKETYRTIIQQGNLKKNEHTKYVPKDVKVTGLTTSVLKRIFDTLYFDFDKSDLKQESIKKLNKLYDYYIQHTSIQIELYAYTDSWGGSVYNKLLAARRGNAVLNYLTSKGVNQSTLVVNAMGEINTHSEDEESSMTEARLKRRVEISLLGDIDCQQPTTTNVYSTQPNRTIHSLAYEYGLTKEELSELNGLTGSDLYLGHFAKTKRSATDNYSYLKPVLETKRFQSKKEARAYNELVENAISNNIRANQNIDHETLKKLIDSVESFERKEIFHKSSGAESVNVNYYIVQPKNTLSNIARLYGISVENLKKINNLTSDSLSTGQKIKIDFSLRDVSVKGYLVRDNDTPESIAARFGITVEDLYELNNLYGYTLRKNMLLKLKKEEEE